MTIITYDFNNARRQDDAIPGRIDAEDIQRRLAGDARAFVEWLFSGRAVIGRHEARVADVSGAAGESLEIELHGPKAGKWYDHATGEGGDLLSLYMAYMGYERGNFQLALKEIAKDYFGDQVELTRAPFQRSAAERIAEKREKLGDKPREENLRLGAPVENYGYYGRDGKVLAVVRRYEPGSIDSATGKPDKTFRACPGFPTPRPLYRIPQILGATHVVLTEGERKADSLASVGIEATTAMGGANTKVEMVDWSVLAGKHVTIWPDKDKAGYDYAQKVAPILLGLGCRVDLVDPPADKPAKWDAHDCVMEGGDPHALIGGAAPYDRKQDEQDSHQLGEIDAGDDDVEIPPRGWLLGNIFCRRFVSSLVADGGVGKTALRYAQLLSLATGRELTGEHVFQRCRVLIVSLEDDIDELRRRIKAARLHFNISSADLKGWLFYVAPGLSGGKLMTMDDKGRPLRGVLADKLERTIIERRIDIVSLDPFVKSHSVEENSNSLIDDVVQILTEIAIKHDLAVDVPHHASKGASADPGNANRSRGASAAKDAFRLVYTLTPMSRDESESMGVVEAERRFLIRMDSGKVNIAPPMTEATWFKLVGVRLGNETKTYPNGDEVQTVDRWKPRNVCSQLSSEAIQCILDDIDAGLQDGNLYTDGRNAGDRAAWRVVCHHAPEMEEKAASKVIKQWVNSGLLVRAEYKNPANRHPANGLKVDRSKRPS